jgi:hypothetical protein
MHSNSIACLFFVCFSNFWLGHPNPCEWCLIVSKTFSCLDVLQEHADLVMASRNPGIGNGVQSLNEWLDMRGLDRRLKSSDIATSTPRYDINRISF